MLWVVNLGNTPRVDPGTDGLAIDLDLLLRTNDGEGHHGLNRVFNELSFGDCETWTYAKLAVVLNGILVILFNVVREVVHGDVVVLDVFHNLIASNE